MSAIYVLIGLTIVFAVACVVLRSKNRSFEGMICKFMASFGFIAVAFLGIYVDQKASPNIDNIRYFCLVAVALMFGFCGDVFLGIKEIAPTFKKKLIPIGAGYFLIGHLFYMAALITLEGFSFITLIFFAVGFLFAFLMLTFVMNTNLNTALRIVMAVYYGVLVCKAAYAVWVVIKNACPANILALVGSLLFVASDTCLAFLYFTPVKHKNAFVTGELSTYYPAQILLAMSVAFR